MMVEVILGSLTAAVIVLAWMLWDIRKLEKQLFDEEED